MDYISKLPDEIALMIARLAPKLTRTSHRFLQLDNDRDIPWQCWLDDYWFTPTIFGAPLISVFYHLSTNGVCMSPRYGRVKLIRNGSKHSTDDLNEMLLNDVAYLTNKTLIISTDSVIQISILIDKKIAYIYIVDKKIQFVDYDGIHISIVPYSDGTYHFHIRNKNGVSYEIADGELSHQMVSVCANNGLSMLVDYLETIIREGRRTTSKKIISEYLLGIMQ
jgi:hypothetical protein